MNKNKPGRVDPGQPVFCGHKGDIQDIEFMPYYDNYFASCSGDGTVKLWEVPEN